jgi:hypothetical protein
VKIKDDKQLGQARALLPKVKDAKLRLELEDAISSYEAQAPGMQISLDGPKPGPPIEPPPVETVPVTPTTQDVVDPERRAIQGALGFPVQFDSPDAFAVPPPAQGTRTGTTTAFRVEPGTTQTAGAPVPGKDPGWQNKLPKGARWLPEGEGETFDPTARGVQKGKRGADLDRLESALDGLNRDAAAAAGVPGIQIGPDGKPMLAAERAMPADPFYDEGIPNLSKDARFYTPPVNTAGSAAGRVVHHEPSYEYARSLLQNSPSLREQVGMAPDQELPKKLPSDVYARVADRLYEQIYERATTEGKQVYRYSQLEKYLDPVENRWAFAATNAAIPAAQAALWFEQGALGGLGSAAVIDLTTGRSAQPDGRGGMMESASGFGQELADVRGELMESTPEGLSTGAELAGALNPFGMGGKLATGGVTGARAMASKLPLSRLGQSPVARFAGRLGEGAAGGAAVGAGMSMAGDVSAEVMRGARSDPWRTPQEQGIQGIFDRAASGAMGGALFGALAQPGADAAGEAVRRLRGSNRALYTLEQSGGQQDLFFTRMNNEVGAAMKKYREAPKGSRAPLVIDQLTDDAFQIASSRGKEYGTGVIVAEGQAKERYYQSPAGRQKKPPKALFDQAWAESSGTKKAVTDPDVYRLSTKAAKDAMRMLSEPVWVLAVPSGNPTYPPKRPSRRMHVVREQSTLVPLKKEKGVLVRPPEEFRAVLGDEWLQQALDVRPNSQGNVGTYWVLGVRPKPMTARTFDAVLSSLDDAARRSESGPQSTKGETPEFLARMARAAHQDREQWKGNKGKKPDEWPTWAEGMRGSSERLGEAERRLSHMGIPFSAEEAKFAQPLTAQQETAVKAKLRAYQQRDSGGGEDIDAAFDFVVSNPAERQKLLNVAQYLAAQKMKSAKAEAYGGSNVQGGAGVTSTGLLAAGRDKVLYPAAKGLAGSADDWAPKKGRLDLSPAVLAWLDAYVTHGSMSLAGGMPARAIQPLDALELLLDTAVEVSKAAYGAGKEEAMDSARGMFGRPARPVVRPTKPEPEEEEYE